MAGSKRPRFGPPGPAPGPRAPAPPDRVITRPDPPEIPGARNLRRDDAGLVEEQGLHTLGLAWKSRELALTQATLGQEVDLFAMPGRAALDVYARIPTAQGVQPGWRLRLKTYASGGDVDILVAESVLHLPDRVGRVVRLRDRYAPRWKVRLLTEAVPPDLGPALRLSWLATAFGESNTLPPVYLPFRQNLPLQTATLWQGPAGISSASILVPPTAAALQLVGLYDTDPAAPVFDDTTLRQRWAVAPGQSVQWHGVSTVTYRTAVVLYSAVDMIHTAGEPVSIWGTLDATAELEGVAP